MGCGGVRVEAGGAVWGQRLMVHTKPTAVLADVSDIVTMVSKRPRATGVPESSPDAGLITTPVGSSVAA